MVLSIFIFNELQQHSGKKTYFLFTWVLFSLSMIIATLLAEAEWTRNFSECEFDSYFYFAPWTFYIDTKAAIKSTDLDSDSSGDNKNNSKIIQRKKI